jgi:hypothetical protein
VIAPPVIEDGNITITWSGAGELETATDQVRAMGVALRWGSMASDRYRMLSRSCSGSHIVVQTPFLMIP